MIHPNPFMFYSELCKGFAELIELLAKKHCTLYIAQVGNGEMTQGFSEYTSFPKIPISILSNYMPARKQIALVRGDPVASSGL